uniref:Uncharacterized protein n=1 Tax=Placozoa sp. H2 TaxID=573895 RepID=A0A7I6N458_9METZ|nr:hypothetical protein [Placozoa sp. H2 HM-2017]
MDPTPILLDRRRRRGSGRRPFKYGRRRRPNEDDAYDFFYRRIQRIRSGAFGAWSPKYAPKAPTPNWEYSSLWTQKELTGSVGSLPTGRIRPKGADGRRPWGPNNSGSAPKAPKSVRKKRIPSCVFLVWKGIRWIPLLFASVGPFVALGAVWCFYKYYFLVLSHWLFSRAQSTIQWLA